MNRSLHYDTKTQKRVVLQAVCLAATLVFSSLAVGQVQQVITDEIPANSVLVPMQEEVAPAVEVQPELVPAAQSDPLAIPQAIPQTAPQDGSIQGLPQADVLPTVQKTLPTVQSTLPQRQVPQNTLPQRNITQHVDSSHYVDDINQIRQRLGGGVASQLEGMLDDNSKGQLQEDFNDQIRAMADQASTSIGTKMLRPQDQATEYRRPRRGQGVLGTLPRADQGNPNLPAVYSNQPMMNAGHVMGVATTKVGQFRSAARYLDLAANDLEQLEMYNQADELRRQANEYRQQARQDN